MVYEKYILIATVKLISICIMYLMFYEEPIHWILQFPNCNLHAYFHLCLCILCLLVTMDCCYIFFDEILSMRKLGLIYSMVKVFVCSFIMHFNI